MNLKLLTRKLRILTTYLAMLSVGSHFPAASSQVQSNPAQMGQIFSSMGAGAGGMGGLPLPAAERAGGFNQCLRLPDTKEEILLNRCNGPGTPPPQNPQLLQQMFQADLAQFEKDKKYLAEMERQGDPSITGSQAKCIADEATKMKLQIKNTRLELEKNIQQLKNFKDQLLTASGAFGNLRALKDIKNALSGQNNLGDNPILNAFYNRELKTTACQFALSDSERNPASKKSLRGINQTLVPRLELSDNSQHEKIAKEIQAFQMQINGVNSSKLRSANTLEDILRKSTTAASRGIIDRLVKAENDRIQSTIREANQLSGGRIGVSENLTRDTQRQLKEASRRAPELTTVAVTQCILQKIPKGVTFKIDPKKSTGASQEKLQRYQGEINQLMNLASENQLTTNQFFSLLQQIENEYNSKKTFIIIDNGKATNFSQFLAQDTFQVCRSEIRNPSSTLSTGASGEVSAAQAASAIKDALKRNTNFAPNLINELNNTVLKSTSPIEPSQCRSGDAFNPASGGYNVEVARTCSERIKGCQKAVTDFITRLETTARPQAVQAFNAGYSAQVANAGRSVAQAMRLVQSMSGFLAIQFKNADFANFKVAPPVIPKPSDENEFDARGLLDGGRGTSFDELSKELERGMQSLAQFEQFIDIAQEKEMQIAAERIDKARRLKESNIKKCEKSVADFTELFRALDAQNQQRVADQERTRNGLCKMAELEDCEQASSITEIMAKLSDIELKDKQRQALASGIPFNPGPEHSATINYIVRLCTKTRPYDEEDPGLFARDKICARVSNDDELKTEIQELIKEAQDSNSYHYVLSQAKTEQNNLKYESIKNNRNLRGEYYAEILRLDDLLKKTTNPYTAFCPKKGGMTESEMREKATKVVNETENNKTTSTTQFDKEIYAILEKENEESEKNYNKPNQLDELIYYIEAAKADTELTQEFEHIVERCDAGDDSPRDFEDEFFDDEEFEDSRRRSRRT